MTLTKIHMRNEDSGPFRQRERQGRREGGKGETLRLTDFSSGFYEVRLGDAVCHVSGAQYIP